MSNVMTMTKMKKKEEEEHVADSEIVPVKKRELLARFKGDEIKYKSCYEDCVKYAVVAKELKEEVDDYHKILEANRSKFNDLKSENLQLKSELGIYKSKTVEVSKEIESSSHPLMDVQKDVAERLLKTKEARERDRKLRQEKYRFE